MNLLQEGNYHRLYVTHPFLKSRFKKRIGNGKPENLEKIRFHLKYELEKHFETSEITREAVNDFINSFISLQVKYTVNKIYTYKESGAVDIVRLLDVYKDKGYIYCTLYFFNENKTITVSQILQPDDYVIWRILDDREFDEIMSRRLWREVNQKEELLEFDF